MNLRELKGLIELQLAEDPKVGELEVMAEYDYGDRHHTRALSSLRELIKARPVKTAYSASGLALEEDDDPDSEQESVMVLTLGD